MKKREFLDRRDEEIKTYLFHVEEYLMVKWGITISTALQIRRKQGGYKYLEEKEA